MKKNLFLLLVCMGCASVSLAQIKTDSNTGKVGIGLPSNTAPLSKLTVGSRPGNTSALAYMFSAGQPYTLQISSVACKAGIYAEALSSNSANNYKAVAIHGVGGSESSTTPSTIGVGVRGVAIKYGFGVSGLINSQVLMGAGVYGAVADDEYFPVYGQYAGYFDGNVNVNGTLSATSISNSDVRYKKDISELDSKKSLKSILMMRPVEYRLEQQYAEVTSIDSVTKSEVTKQCPLYDEKSQVFQKKHYGLIAQELQELYPDLVYEVDDRGYLGINYMEIIPMLIQSVQEQQRQNEDQQKQIDELKRLVGSKSILKSSEEVGDVTGISSETITNKATLYQNVPNPFNQSTEIRYYIPENSQSVQLCIYNLQGNQIKQIVVTERGESSYLLSASELTAGMYLYTLIIDGKEIDTKRMILTE